MKCEYCENNIAPGNTFCPACGAKVESKNTASGKAVSSTLETDSIFSQFFGSREDSSVSNDDIKRIKEETALIQERVKLEQAKAELNAIKQQSASYEEELNNVKQQASEYEEDREDNNYESNNIDKNYTYSNISPFDKNTFTTLGLLFGGLGIHLLYIKRFGVGITMFILGIAGLINMEDSMFPILIFYIIGWISTAKITTDGNGKELV